MRRTLKRFLDWQVTVTIRPALVLALIVGDILLRMVTAGLAKRVLPILSVATSIMLALLLLLFVYCVTDGKRR